MDSEKVLAFNEGLEPSYVLFEEARDLLNLLSAQAGTRGLRIPKVQERSRLPFSKLDPRLQSKFVQTLRSYEKIFKMQIDVMDDFLDVSAEEEAKCLDVVRREYGLSLPRDFDNTLASGDIIELYDVDSIQIYRNLNFFKTSNYDLMDVISHTWMELWDRPAFVEDSLARMVKRVFTPGAPAIAPCEVPDHILRERAFGMSQALMISFKNVARVEDQYGNPAGVLLTLRAEPFAEGPEVDKLGFI